MDGIFVAFRTKQANGDTKSFFSQSSADHHTALGIIEASKFKFQMS